MSNFYTDNKRYLKFVENLKVIDRYDLVSDLHFLVYDAVMYGIDQLAENLKESPWNTTSVSKSEDTAKTKTKTDANAVRY